jgi:uncharacterized protein
MSEIFRRVILDDIDSYLNTDDVIVLHGARQVGKTSILRYIQNQLVSCGECTCFIDLEDSRYVRMLDAGVEMFLKYLDEEGIEQPDKEKKRYVFIDEIQYLSEPSSFLKLMADHHRDIKLIVSGSSSFAIKTKFKDSLVGRTVDFEIFPLSFQEFLLFNSIELKTEKAFTEKKIGDLKASFKEYLLFGGYPRIVLTPEVNKKEKYLQQIVDTYVKKDIRDLAGVKDVDKFNKLVEALAGQSGQLLNMTELSNTTRLSVQTVEKYLFVLENTYIIRLVRPFSGNVRSELFKLPKIFFFDTGLMQMLWLKGLQKEILGQVFESGVFSELIKKYGKENVFFWRTKDRKEIDFVLRKKDAVIPIEAKINFGHFQSRAMKYFVSHYGVEDTRIVGLNGEKRDSSCYYPWEL